MLRGLCEVIAVPTKFTTALVAAALERSVHVAFQAVRKPVEGTMLTVLKDAADAARAVRPTGLALDEFLEAVVQAAFESVRRDPRPAAGPQGERRRGRRRLRARDPRRRLRGRVNGREFRDRTTIAAAAPLLVGRARSTTGTTTSTSTAPSSCSSATRSTDAVIDDYVAPRAARSSWWAIGRRATRSTSTPMSPGRFSGPTGAGRGRRRSMSTTCVGSPDARAIAPQGARPGARGPLEAGRLRGGRSRDREWRRSCESSASTWS